MMLRVTITDETNFFENIPKDVAIGYRDVSRDLETGNYVEIISNGTIMESYPMQTTASAVAVNKNRQSKIKYVVANNFGTILKITVNDASD